MSLGTRPLIASKIAANWAAVSWLLMMSRAGSISLSMSSSEEEEGPPSAMGVETWSFF